MTADKFIVVQWLLKIYLHVEELPWGDVVVWAQHCMENTQMGGQAFRQLTPILPRVTLCLLTSVFVKVAVRYWTSPNFKVSFLHHNFPSWFELLNQLTWRCISVFDRLKSLQLQPAPLKSDKRTGWSRESLQSPHQRLKTDNRPVHFLILNLLFVPNEDTRHGREQFTRGRMLALKSAPYAAHQGPSGPLRVQVGVKFADLTCTPEPLSGYKAAVVREYGE